MQMTSLNGACARVLKQKHYSYQTLLSSPVRDCLGANVELHGFGLKLAAFAHSGDYLRELYALTGHLQVSVCCL